MYVMSTTERTNEATKRRSEPCRWARIKPAAAAAAAAIPAPAAAATAAAANRKRSFSVCLSLPLSFERSLTLLLFFRVRVSLENSQNSLRLNFSSLVAHPSLFGPLQQCQVAHSGGEAWLSSCRRPNRCPFASPFRGLWSLVVAVVAVVASCRRGRLVSSRVVSCRVAVRTSNESTARHAIHGRAWFFPDRP